MSLAYAVETPGLEEATAVYEDSGLAARRQMHKLDAALAGSDLIVCAREDGRLVGVARSITDWGLATYLADLAVAATHQRTGIGRELIERTHAAAPRTRLFLFAAPDAVDYYPRVGMERHPAGFMLPPRAT